MRANRLRPQFSVFAEISIRILRSVSSIPNWPGMIGAVPLKACLFDQVRPAPDPAVPFIDPTAPGTAREDRACPAWCSRESAVHAPTPAPQRISGFRVPTGTGNGGAVPGLPANHPGLQTNRPLSPPQRPIPGPKNPYIACNALWNFDNRTRVRSGQRAGG